VSNLSVLRIPVPAAQSVQLRLSPLPRVDDFNPNGWRHVPLSNPGSGWWEIDVSGLGLSDGRYEYEFVVQFPGQSSRTVPDPYAEQITRLSGYRAVLDIQGGQRVRLPFSWENELPSGGLPNNNEIVIYELPMRWVDAGEEGYARQVGLGTFDKARFQHLEDHFRPLGINCIELLPVQDSPDTLNWGYGTRFFFAPDIDMGEPFDLKLFVKGCHQAGIRVIMDLVMNHARGCPLWDLASEWFFLKDGSEERDQRNDWRPDWGGKIFRYREQRGGDFLARKFHFGVAEYLIREYHVDGFRLDEFKGIDNYDFVRDFTDHAHQVHGELVPARPFTVIAEDSWRRANITRSGSHGRRVVNSMWDFNFRDDVRRLVSNTLWTTLGEPSRSDRVRMMLSAGNEDVVRPDERDRRYFVDMADRVTYCTSHDIGGDEEQRLMPFYLARLGSRRGVGDNEPGLTSVAFEQVFSTFALTLTAAGIPMFLAGEEFADLHDIDRRNWQYKMSDPVDWARASLPGNREVLERIRKLIALRTSHKALHWNEVAFFGIGDRGFHPTFDENDGERLFAYCRTGGQPLGRQGQVIVVANCRDRDYPEVWLDWPWGFQSSLAEHGGRGQSYPEVAGLRARLALGPYQVRVFSV
jgi:1,4-alpha-glucan branching enzyme